MISVVVLTHNDEKIISKCLKSLTWCDEIIVVDDDSTDKTKEAAKKFGAKVVTRKLSDDFAAQRNFGLKQAKGEWVLFVDSDEVVPGGLASEILSITISQRNQKDGYYLKRTDWFTGRWLTHGEPGNVALLRLARKGSGSWVRPVHEVWEVVGPLGELRSSLFHFPHPNVAQFLDEINRYSTLNAYYLKSQGVRASLWEIIVYPNAKFFLNYFWRLGFLDGTAGAVVAIMMSFHSFLVRAKLYLLWQSERKKKEAS